MATAQHLTELAQGLVARGHEVTVVASSRGYDDPSKRYPVNEVWQGITIRRIWTPGLGKGAKWRRLVDFAIFWLNATRILLFLPRQDVTVCLTSPPLIAVLGSWMARLKGGRVIPWVMDLNPDEAVAAGWLKAGGVAEKVLSLLQNNAFHHAARIMALDRFMAARLQAKGVDATKVHVDAPWSHDDQVCYDAEARERFRSSQSWNGRFVVMYSGNHSPCHPLDTVLEAARVLAEDDRCPIHFAFVGGGSEWVKVKQFAEEHRLTNVSTLPYQPLEQLSGSLSAADLHLVVMGDPFVGIVHPCKIYNLLRLGLPVVTMGPAESHLNDLVQAVDDPVFARHLPNGDLPGLLEILRRAAEAGPCVPSDKMRAVGARFSKDQLLPRFIDVVEVGSKR